MLNKKISIYPVFLLLVVMPLLSQRAAALALADLPAMTAPEIPAASAPDRIPPPDVDVTSPRAVAALSSAQMAAATPEQRLAMLKTLVAASRPAMGSEDYGQQETEAAIHRLFETSSDAASFDNLYYHVRRLKLSGAVSDFHSIEKQANRYLAATAPGDWAGLAAYVDAVTGSRPEGLNGVDFLIDSRVLPAATAAIDAAGKSIHIEVYQLQADEIGWGLARKLAAKAKAGVQVRLIVDFYGSGVKNNAEIRKLLAFLNESGAEAIVHNSPRFTGSRDHRKVMVIDGRVGFTGGMNIGGHYQVQWHDQQTMLTGPAVARLQDSFIEKWAEAGGAMRDVSEHYPKLESVPGGVEARVVYHRGNDDRNIKALYLKAFYTAQKSVRVAVPYFADPDIVEGLCAAARRGAKVQLVLPGANDKGISLKSSRSFYPRLLEAGVEIYEYQGRMAHQKVAVMDGLWSTFGSSNLDSRSLKNNHELNVVVRDENLAGYIGRELFDADLLKSERILNYKPTLSERIAGRLYPWL